MAVCHDYWSEGLGSFGIAEIPLAAAIGQRMRDSFERQVLWM